jgi:hypothetical protein
MRGAYVSAEKLFFPRLRNLFKSDHILFTSRKYHKENILFYKNYCLSSSFPFKSRSNLRWQYFWDNNKLKDYFSSFLHFIRALIDRACNGKKLSTQLFLLVNNISWMNHWTYTLGAPNFQIWQSGNLWCIDYLYESLNPKYFVTWSINQSRKWCQSLI